jgi:UDPglucose--hexose-1-phosphate uridylyltransferase
MQQEDMFFFDAPHTRRNPLTGEWTLVSPHRAKRPWRGLEEAVDDAPPPRFDPACYLCPGNVRAGGEINPTYEGTFVFTNDFAALLSESISLGKRRTDEDELFVAAPETGVCRVICYSPRHDLSMALLSPERILGVVEAWKSEHAALSAREDIGHVQIFENRGDIMGCSNPHPHGQIWATRSVPAIPAAEGLRQDAYLKKRGAVLLDRYLEKELAAGERVVFANDSFAAVVPFWAVWPFETLILPRFPMPSIQHANAAQRADLADALRRMAIRYDNLFKTSFPYSMGIHQEPADGLEHPEWRFHMHYYPPLLRSRSVRKFMVGFEMLAMPQRDLTPEESARRLREQPEIHYLLKG